MKKKFYLCILFLVTSLLYSLPYTHYTSDYLRIRNDYNLNSQIITVLEPNMGVEIIAKGKKETIDGIKSNWVKVISANGYVGWCFAGYLKPIEKDVSEILAKEVEKVKAGAYSNNYSLSNLKNISSILGFQGSEGYYIQQQSRGFQNSGRAPEILQLVIDNEKVFVKEIDIVNGEILTLKGSEFVFNGKTFAHNKSNIKLNDKNQINIFYLENVPENQWLGTYEYDKPYTKVPNINYNQLVNQTTDVLKNYAGVYKFDSFKIIKNENYIFPSLNVQNSKIDITYNDIKKCLSVKYSNLSNIVVKENSRNWTLDFIETSSMNLFSGLTAKVLVLKNENFGSIKVE
ncbi:MAG: SH3 domain-containing protein [Spirochaetaceae bacterium]|nr:SH3 domain-containing protein [Spirochaetaceae bacterium]